MAKEIIKIPKLLIHVVLGMNNELDSHRLIRYLAEGKSTGDRRFDAVLEQFDADIKKLNTKKEKQPVAKKEFIPPSLEEVLMFFKFKGYKEEVGRKAFDYYSNMGWKDSSGKPVLNWKGKMIAVWFKDENKFPKSSGNINAVSSRG